MKLKIIALSLLYCISFIASGKEELANSKVANQHIAVGVLAAIYYCDNGKWPKSMLELKDFQAQDGTELPVTPDWNLLLDSRVIFDVSEDITLSTPADKPRKLVMITSKHSKPGCDNGNIEPRIDIKLGG